MDQGKLMRENLRHNVREPRYITNGSIARMERELQKNSRNLQSELMAIQGEGDPEEVSIGMLESIEHVFAEVD